MNVHGDYSNWKTNNCVHASKDKIVMAPQEIWNIAAFIIYERHSDYNFQKFKFGTSSIPIYVACYRDTNVLSLVLNDKFQKYFFLNLRAC